jgi:hypothetical protein
MEDMGLVLDGLMAEGEDAGTVVETPEAGGEQGGEQQQQGGEQEIDPDTGLPIDKGQADDKQDGRKNPDAIRKHLAQLKANPETAELGKEVTNRLGKVRGYEEVFPTVREAREVKQWMDTVGGRDAVTAAVESHATMQRVDAMLATGNKEVLKDIFQQAPEGMVKLTGPILDEVQKLNPTAYKGIITPHAVAMLNNDGMPGALNALVDAFNKDDKAGMQDLIGRLVQYYKGLMQGAKPAGKDPDREAFEQEKTEFRKQNETQAITQTFNANLEYSAGKIDAGLAADIKRLNLSPKAVEKLRQDVWREIETRRKADKTFMSTLQSKFDGKMPKPEAAAHLNGFTDRTVQAAIDDVVETYYGPRKVTPKTDKIDPTAPKKRPGASGAGAGAAADTGWVKVPGPPDRKDIDYSHKDTDPINGKAVLKSGKRAQWR